MSEMVRVEHRAVAGSRWSIGMLLFVSLSCTVGPVILAVLAFRAPATRVLTCDRAQQRCAMENMWGTSVSSFVLSQLRDLRLFRSKHDVVLGAVYDGHRNYWTGEVRGTDKIAAMEAAYAAIQEFARDGATAPTLRVEIPNGRPAGTNPLLLLFVLAFGAWIAIRVRRTIWRSEVVVDPAARTVAIVTHRPLARARRISAATTDIQEVVTQNTQLDRGGYYLRYTRVVLVRAEEEPIAVLQEYTSPRAAARGREVAGALASALGVPRTGT